MTKDQVLHILDQLPDEFELEALVEQLLFVHQIDQRIAQFDRNEVLSFEEARQRFQQGQHSNAA